MLSTFNFLTMFYFMCTPHTKMNKIKGRRVFYCIYQSGLCLGTQRSIIFTVLCSESAGTAHNIQHVRHNVQAETNND